MNIARLIHKVGHIDKFELSKGPDQIGIWTNKIHLYKHTGLHLCSKDSYPYGEPSNIYECEKEWKSIYSSYIRILTKAAEK